MPPISGGGGTANYDVTADCQKFLFASVQCGNNGALSALIIVVLNWQGGRNKEPPL